MRSEIYVDNLITARVHKLNYVLYGIIKLKKILKIIQLIVYNYIVTWYNINIEINIKTTN